MKDNRRSFLQVQILIGLQEAPAKTITEIAERIDALRPSVSRSIRSLKEQGFVYRDRQGWHLTEDGLEEARQSEKSMIAAAENLQMIASRNAEIISNSFRKSLLPGIESRITKQFNPIVDAYMKLFRKNNAFIDRIQIDFVNQIEEVLLESIRSQMSIFGTRILKSLEETDSSAKRIAPIMAEAKIWYSPSMTLEPIKRLNELLENGRSSPDDVIESFVGCFEEDNWSELQRIVTSWEDNPYFNPRMQLIMDALDAHVNGKYTLSIPLLLAQAEGIASDILNVPAGESTKLMKQVLDLDHHDFIREISRDVLLRYILSPSGFGRTQGDSQEFTSHNFADWLNSYGVSEEQAINRHGILHGVQLNYGSKMNSLRAFFLLDTLHFINWRDWSRAAQLILKNQTSTPS